MHRLKDRFRNRKASSPTKGQTVPKHSSTPARPISPTGQGSASVSTSQPSPSVQPVQPPLAVQPVTVSSSSTQPSVGIAQQSPQSLTTTSSSNKRDLWAEALQQLTTEQRNALSTQQLSGQGVVQSNSASIDDLIDLVDKKKEQCEAGRWKFKINGRDIILRDIADKIIHTITKLKDVGDLLASIDSVHAAPAWAGVKILLQFATADSEQMAVLLTGVQAVTRITSRCKVYELIFLQNYVQDSALDNLITALLSSYVEVLQFLANTSRIYSKNTAARIFLASFSIDKIQSFDQTCRNLEQQLEAEASNCDRVVANLARDESKDHLAKIRQAISSLDEPIIRTDLTVSKLWVRSEQWKNVKILQWISDVPYVELHLSEQKNRTKDTGSWLLNNSRYRQWRNSSASTFLWLHGIPGAGKTVLVTSVVDDMLSVLKGQPNDEGFAYFYCKRYSEERRTGESVLRSFVRQLSIDRTGDAMQPSMVKLYDEKEKQGLASGRLTMRECKTILLEYTGIYPQTTFVLDALDECDEGIQIALIDVFDEIVRMSHKVVKFFISSRPYDRIKLRFERGPNVGIKATDNQDDIAKHIQWQLDECDRSRRHKLSRDTRDKISTTLLEKNEGMFQWVSLQLLQLTKMKAERDMMERLGKLPLDLEKTYQEIYAEIQRRPEEFIVAQRAFVWIMASFRPLGSKELAALVCQDPLTSEIDEIDRHVEDVLDACANLVFVDSQLDQCRFSHLSVEEYLETRGYTKTHNHNIVAKVCTRLLLSDAFEENMSFLEKGKITKRNPNGRDLSTHSTTLDPCEGESLTVAADFGSRHRDTCSQRSESELSYSTDSGLSPVKMIFSYAAGFWSHHLQVCEQGQIDPRLSALVIQFVGSFDESGPKYRKWLQVLARHRRRQSPVWTHRPGGFIRFWTLRPDHKASLFACDHGLYKIFQNEWGRGSFDVNQCDRNGNSLLMLGARHGSVHVCRRLIELGADVNGDMNDYQKTCRSTSNSMSSETALDKAVDAQHAKIVQQLLENGASVAFAEKRSLKNANSPVLHRAAAGGNLVIVQLLLEHGADVNLLDYRQKTALGYAVDKDHTSVVRLLLERGTTKDVETTLHTAICHRSIDTVQCFIDHEVNLDWVDYEKGTALQVLAVLLDEDEEGRFLQRAQFLLSYKANPDVTGGVYGSCLQAVAFERSIPAIRLLLKHGVNINLIGGKYGTALQAAAASTIGDCQDGLEKMRVLLDAGANPNLEGGFYGTALQAAVATVRDWSDCSEDLRPNVCSARMAKIRLLLDFGANPTIAGGCYDSVLLAAANAKAELPAMRYFNPFGFDSRQEIQSFNDSEGFQTEQYEIMSILLDKGVSANVRSARWGSALHAMADIGDLNSMQLLLDHGADVNLQTMGPNLTQMFFDQAVSSNYQQGSIQPEETSIHSEEANAENARGMTQTEEKGVRIVEVNISADLNEERINDVKHEQDVGYASYEGKQNGRYNAIRQFPSTALHAALSKRQAEATRLLLQQGADVNILDPIRGTPLCITAHEYQPEEAKLLLKHGADVDAKVEGDDGPIHKAMQYRNTNIVRMLLDAGADPTIAGFRGRTVLYLAACDGYNDLVQLFLDKGADPNVRDETGDTALQASIANKQWSTAKLLFDHGAKLEPHGVKYHVELGEFDPDDPNGMQPIDVIKLILDAGATMDDLMFLPPYYLPQEPGDYGYALQYVARQGVVDLLKVLLEHRIDSQSFVQQTSRALYGAANEGEVESLQLLFSNGADVNFQDEKQGTPLIAAASCTKSEIRQNLVEDFLARGAEINGHGGFYGSALQAVSLREDANLVKLLIDRGANVNFKGGRYGTALEAAKDRDNHEIIELLRQAGAVEYAKEELADFLNTDGSDLSRIATPPQTGVESKSSSYLSVSGSESDDGFGSFYSDDDPNYNIEDDNAEDGTEW